MARAGIWNPGLALGLLGSLAPGDVPSRGCRIRRLFRPKAFGELFATRLYGKSEAGAGVWASRTAAAAACRAGERRRVLVLLVLIAEEPAAPAKARGSRSCVMGPTCG
jgi:hypothetical protein